MRVFRVMSIMAVGLVFGLPLTASDAQEAATPDEATPVKKDLFHIPVRIEAADGVIDRGPSWGHSGPWVEDVDGDGVKDLVIGDFSGLFRYYRNAGTNRLPLYELSVNLQVGGEDAKVPIY